MRTCDDDLCICGLGFQGVNWPYSNLVMFLCVRMCIYETVLWTRLQNRDKIHQRYNEASG